ncbi:MAG: hypothetical protein EOL95_07130 [Bacteroidia bacterium]|nr:hypothetical protein [Bacteroidia bacterium]
MAKKIAYYCQYNQRALSLFATANAEIIQNRTDLANKLLEKLDKHLDCAENFIITLYYNYGVEMSYFALKDAGFTIQETDKAELIWEKEQEKGAKSEQDNNEAENRRRVEAEKLSKQRSSKESSLSKDISKTSTDEEVVDLNDYFNSDTGWDDETDWNHTSIDDEDVQMAFDRILKKNGIYWSETNNAWVKQKNKQVTGLGTGVSNSSFNIAGRSAIKFPQPRINQEIEGGVIIVDVEITPEGKVVNAKINNKTTALNKSAKQSCLDSALKSEFSKSNLNKNQSGTISYRIKTQ